MDTVCPGRKYNLVGGTRVASLDTVRLSLSYLPLSKARMAVITLVVLAGGKRKSASF